MTASFSAEERRSLARALDADHTPVCPHCGSELTRRAVERPPTVSYVRRRIWLLCPTCKRSGAVDLRGGGPP